VLKSGASGIFLKSGSSHRLVQAIRLVASGESWVESDVIELIADRARRIQDPWLAKLTPVEQTVLSGLLDGLTSKEIGTRCGLSESTVKGVIQRLFEKAGVHKRSRLVRVVLQESQASPNLIPQALGRVSHPHIIF